MRSLQARLSTGLIVALFVLVGLGVLVAGYSLRHLAEEFVASRLVHDMDALLVALSFDSDGRPVLNPNRFNPVFHQPYSGHYYKIITKGGELRSRSLWDFDLPLPPTTTDAVTRYFTRGPENEELLVLARRFRVQQRSVVLAVTEDFTPLAAGLRRLMLGFLTIAGILLGALIYVQRLLVRRGLQPLEDIRLDMLRLGRGEIRHLRQDAPIEIQPLVNEINRLLAIMEQRLQRSRHAVGNLAHALKAPLTVLTHLTDPQDQSQPSEWAGEVARQTRQIRQLVDRELRRARIAGAATPGQRVVLNTEVDDLVDTLKKVHRDKPLLIDCHIPGNTLFPGDRDDLLELLGNLLDNACQWAAGRVRLTVRPSADWLILHIEDDGPGCPPELLTLLTQRGVRVDESRAGHGLGLAIVTDIVDQYGGYLELTRSNELGGLAVTVTLPAGAAEDGLD
ncbi:MAG: sensor histidine kinase [Gammaproteobacteria bacterium]|nr:sensor histidine kinase [Gammaproteobacteria bacterium]MCP5425510.1 sensor histidine kinase [Gammaproteobacteria bacterium]MCP5459370.1 sensor histidine kinase [Gammaproteobacteria bacterium]